MRSLVLNGTYCRGDHFLREVIRTWQWAARKSDDLRDFLNVVNLWCFSPRIYNEGTMEGWLDEAAASAHAAERGRVLPLGGRPASSTTRADRAGRDRRARRSSPSASWTSACPSATRAELVERIPGARLRILEANGHQPFQEGPEAYNAILAEFWAST